MVFVGFLDGCLLMKMTISRTGQVAGILLVSTLLCSCGNKESGKTASQVAARVNGAEITVHQVNQLVGRLQGVTEQNAARARQDVLEKLIDQQLAVEQATERKLERQLDVMAAIEAARRDVLARAYLDQLIAAQTKPGDDEVKKYYAAHPELFAERRVFKLQELLVENGQELLPALREKTASAKSMDDVANWLKEKQVRFAAQGGIRPAEQIPMELLATLHKAKDGETVVMGATQGAAIIKIVSSQVSPIDEATAMPRIQQFLAIQRNKDFVESSIKLLRDKAKIEYVGDFGAKQGETAKAKPAAEKAAVTESTPANDDVAKAIRALK